MKKFEKNKRKYTDLIWFDGIPAFMKRMKKTFTISKLGLYKRVFILTLMYWISKYIIEPYCEYTPKWNRAKQRHLSFFFFFSHILQQTISIPIWPFWENMTTITYFVLNVASFLSMWERDFKADKKQTIPKHYLLVISEQLGDTRLCKKPSNPLQGEEWAWPPERSTLGKKTQHLKIMCKV